MTRPDTFPKTPIENWADAFDGWIEEGAPQTLDLETMRTLAYILHLTVLRLEYLEGEK